MSLAELTAVRGAPAWAEVPPASRRGAWGRLLRSELRLVLGRRRNLALVGGLGAMVATVVVAVVSGLLDTIPQLAAIQPGLLTHHWVDFAEFLRLEVDWSLLGQGLAVQAAWAVVFGSLAWSRFTTADVTS